MALDKQALFQTLLEQVQLANHVDFQELKKTGRLEAVTVYKGQGCWEFSLGFEDILPLNLYLILKDTIQSTFKGMDIETRLVIKSQASDFSQDKLQDYWQEAVRLSQIDSPICQSAFAKQLPYKEGKKVSFQVENEVVAGQFQKAYFPSVVAAYEKLGFPHFVIDPVVDKEASQESIKAFREDQQKRAEAEAKRAAENIQKFQAENQSKKLTNKPEKIQLGRGIKPNEEVTQMIDIREEERSIVVEGYVFDVEIRKLRSGRQLLLLKITDYSSSLEVKKFSNNEEDEAVFAAIKEGMWLRVKGSIQEDSYSRDLTMMARDLSQWKHEDRKDTAPEDKRRVELHAHSTMSQLDGMNSVSDIIEKAAEFGHQAVAITDHAGVQAFPEAQAASRKAGIKMLYGMDAYVVDDGVPIAYNLQDLDLSDATYVAFDVETTGLSAVYDNIIELSGVKFHKGNVVDKFEEFIDPGRKLSQTIINLTGITDDMLKGSKSEAEVVKAFREFTKDTILVAHNASFDIGFINKAYQRHDLPEVTNPVIDTLEMSRFLHPEQKTHGLGVLAKRYDVVLEQHHRAIYDAETTGNLAWIFIKEAAEDHQMTKHSQLNDKIGHGESYKQARPYGVTILAQTQEGLKNLFKLVSLSSTEYFYRTPRIPRSKLEDHREGLIFSSSGADGEVFTALLQKGYDEAKELAGFYDYLEIMPKGNFLTMLDSEQIQNEKSIEELNQLIVKMGQEIDLPVVATGNVYYLNPEDKIYRDILKEIQTGNYHNHRQPDAHFRTTNEMLEEFAYLGEAKAQEVVVENTQAIADSLEDIQPIKDDLYTPSIEGAEDKIRDMSYAEAKKLYGEDLPAIVTERLEKELTSIIGNGFAVIYLISHELVKKSNDDGYLVGSRGSVGSSLVATFTGITEVNPLKPHYYCPDCHYSEFITDGSVKSGFDLPDKACPSCQTELKRDGQDIPFETFLGFKGDKVPDIDLNFSGEYQAKAHAYTKDLFGEDYVYRAGTISTIKDKTAFGYVKNYERDKSLNYRNAEVDRLSKGLTGVKRTTGQHPGGIVVVPDHMDVHDFTPYQYPADDQTAEWKTTHFDFHSIEDNILKLDILGHDDPTVLRKLQDLSGIDPTNIPMDDPDTMKIFSGTEILGVTPEQIYSKIGTLGVPEFGTPFVRQMLEQTRPTTFAELQQISGLSHGTDVYLGNAEVLIREHDIPLSDVIGCRDDIMVYLQNKGMDDDLAFKIMEHVRKGRGISDEWQAEMRDHGVPEWYIQSCLKIKYMFPRAHATAYIMMALRVAYFKVHMPLYFYAAYFSVRAKDFDLVAMVQGKEALKEVIDNINDKGLDASNKEKDILVEMEIANEMLERGYSFQMVDLYKSHPTDFIIEGDSLIAPFRAVPSLGTNVAHRIVEAREEQEFLSKEDLAKRGKVSKTIMDYLDVNGVLEGLPESNQLSLFDSL